MKTAGEILKKEREKQGLTLEQVAQKTKIRLDSLKAIEKGDYKKLPSPVYIKGFIKTYAQVLNLDVRKVLAFFRREYREKKSFKVPPQPLSKPLITFTPGFLIGFFASVAIITFLFALFWQYRSFAGRPVLLIEQPQDGAKVEALFVQVVGKTDKDCEVFVNGQKIKVEPSGVFSVSVGLNSGLNTLNILARNKIGKETKIERRVEAEIAEAQKPATAAMPKEGPPLAESAEKSAEAQRETTLTPAVYTGLKLEVEIGQNSSWLQVFCDGTEVFQGVLMPGVSRSFEASEKIVFKTGNAGSTRLTLNGKEQEALGEEGEVVEKVFKREETVGITLKRSTLSLKKPALPKSRTHGYVFLEPN